MERVLREPSVYHGGERAAALDVGIRLGEAPLLAPQLLEGGEAYLLARLDDDDGGLGTRGDGVGQGAEQVAPIRGGIGGVGRCTHHHQVVMRRLAQDRLPDR